MKRILPWTIATLAFAATVGTYVYYQNVVKTMQATADAKVLELEGRIQEANERVGAASAKTLEIAKEASLKIQQQKLDSEEKLRTASESIQAASLPETNLAVTFRRAVFATGHVATFKNMTNRSSPFTIVLERPSTGQQVRLEVVLDSGGFKEVGEREGWPFISGDSIQAVQPGHKPKLFLFN